MNKKDQTADHCLHPCDNGCNQKAECLLGRELYDLLLQDYIRNMEHERRDRKAQRAETLVG